MSTHGSGEVSMVNKIISVVDVDDEIYLMDLWVKVDALGLSYRYVKTRQAFYSWFSYGLKYKYFEVIHKNPSLLKRIR